VERLKNVPLQRINLRGRFFGTFFAKHIPERVNSSGGDKKLRQNGTNLDFQY
jgi:hypothetical protein